MNDKIFIDDIEVFAKHGVNVGEKFKLQRFLISAKAQFDATQAKDSDMISHTVDYTELLGTIVEAVQGSSFNLLEKLAQHIAGKVFQKFQQITLLDIVIKKFPDSLADKNFAGLGFSSTFLRNEK
ncbi:MAG: dihydroneopterin aldolase [Puniceicoccales bacterium]|jgi:dihydroneopterin aldolase/2-amino-4-hydroxy-6-hydroxymethyldihydropteridine diphosphokinase|nr:dihydroneopterin aldolase [Puniceicoccales bacterium]